jgi:hypothetical protein
VITFHGWLEKRWGGWLQKQRHSESVVQRLGWQGVLGSYHRHVFRKDQIAIVQTCVGGDATAYLHDTRTMWYL